MCLHRIYTFFPNCCITYMNRDFLNRIFVRDVLLSIQESNTAFGLTFVIHVFIAILIT